MGRRVVVDELEFEVPYGKLAAKTWHEETDESKRVLALHGWMDNAGSFDNLMPQLKHKHRLYIVAMDLPGHGRSSQLPPGSSYSDLSFIVEIRRFLTQLEWIQPSPQRQAGCNGNSERTRLTHGDTQTRKKFSIVGHSLGAHLGLFYASLYPDDVDELVVLDFIKAKTPPVDSFLQQTAEKVDRFIRTAPAESPIMSKMFLSADNTGRSADKGQVIVTYETAIIATIEAHKRLGELTREDAACLLKRSTVAVNTPPNCVIYSRDLRLMSMLNARDNFEINKLMYASIKCDVMIILGKSGMYARDEHFRDKMHLMEEFCRSRAKTFHVQWVEADHYLHMNQAELTAAIVNRYLEAPEDYKVVA